MPYLPSFADGQKYAITVADTFKPLYPVTPPEADQRIYLTTAQDSWGGLERDTLNNLAYFPDPSFVPLLVGMYNGEIVVNNDTIARAEQNNGFDNATGAIVIGKDKTIDFVFQNIIGTLGISVPHPVYLL
jgi:hypothetical protein